MSIPDYQTLMLPLLQLCGDQQTRSISMAVAELAKEFSVTEEEQAEMIPSGLAPRFKSRVAWAKTYLKQAGLLEQPKRGVFNITDEGLSLLKSPPERITANYLDKYPSFVEFRSRSRSTNTDEPVEVSEESPIEVLEQAYGQLQDELAAEVLGLLKSNSYKFFEQAVVDVLIAMGYGGGDPKAGSAIGRSGDGGIDGIINEDKLGLDVVYVQAKRWEGSVGRPVVQQFVGALEGNHAKKGIIATTSHFTGDAIQYAKGLPVKVILIDGERLGRFMIEYNVGVSLYKPYLLKQIDSDYFEEY